MPWYSMRRWDREANPPDMVNVGNDHFLKLMRFDEDRHIWIGETECHLEVTVPEVAESDAPWVLSGPRPRKCPICQARRQRSSTASARTASRQRSGTARTSRRSAPAAKR